MKKFAKMSLVAALAVAGTAASAQPLAEAIKNVDVSGTVVYRYNDYNNDDTSTTAANNGSRTSNNYKIGLTAKAQVNDDVTAVTRFIIGGADNGFASLNTQNTGDANVDVELSNVYFSYTGIANTTVNVGKQGLTTPWTVAIDADGNEQTGTGILALTNLGPVTVAAAYFNQTNLGTTNLKEAINTADTRTDNDTQAQVDLLNNATGATDVATVGVMGNIGPVALDGWYLDMDDLFDSFTVGAKANFDVDAAKLGIEARYTSLDMDNSSDDNDLWKIILTAKAGIFDAKLGFAGTDSEGGLVALDNDAKTAYQTWNMNPNGKKDADFVNASLGVQALPSLHISANFSDMDYETGAGADVDQTEAYAQFVYKMSKNFSTYVRYGVFEQEIDGNDDIDDTRGRIQVQYSF